MLKRVFGKKLSRNYNSRKALFRSLLASLILNGKIETTKTKAKAIQGDLDKLFGLDKRLALARLGNDKEVCNKLFELKSKFKERRSGFSRIINLPNRKGDNARMVRMEFVENK